MEMLFVRGDGVILVFWLYFAFLFLLKRGLSRYHHQRERSASQWQSPRIVCLYRRDDAQFNICFLTWLYPIYITLLVSDVNMPRAESCIVAGPPYDRTEHIRLPRLQPIGLMHMLTNDNYRVVHVPLCS